MQSRWLDIKEDVLELRREGYSFRDIEFLCGVARSTLSGWCGGIPLSSKKKIRLRERWLERLRLSRDKAIIWHKAQKQKRLDIAKKHAEEILNHISLDNSYIQELALAVLYLGEGRKKGDITSLGGSDPQIVKFFLILMKKLYHVDIQRIDCVLFLRADQNIDELKEFWSRFLELPLKNFRRAYQDKRTVGSKTYPDYKGVCALSYGDISIKRRLLYLAELFCNRIIEQGA